MSAMNEGHLKEHPMKTTLHVLALAFISCTPKAEAQKNPLVDIETNMGVIQIEVFSDRVPVTAKNFLDYVRSGFYKDVIFHRVIDGFMLQGGGFDSALQKKPPRATIVNEAAKGGSNARGTLAMARTGDPNSATSQFFINLVDNKRLDHTGKSPRAMGYCVFAKVVKGLDVVDKIAKTKTQCPSKVRAPCEAALPPGMRDVPKAPVVIKSTTIR
jgi:peptidyl-prolyl cis-trans isomerase A (cyclophilin A)